MNSAVPNIGREQPAAAVPAGEPAARERGWGRVILATLAVLLLPATPMLRVLLPVEQPIVLLAPVLAAFALVGWWSGGRWPLAIVWTALATFVLWQFTAGAGAMAWLASGWGVLLAAAFAVTGLLVDREEALTRPLVARALSATALALVLAATITLAVPGGPSALADAVRTESGLRSADVVTSLRAAVSTPDWTALLAQRPELLTMIKQVEDNLRRAPAVAQILFPAFLALESLAAMALAWAVYHRVGRSRLGPPLAALRDFRFSDHLVWGLVLGLLLVVTPWLARLAPVGANLLLFFGALYALRGLGVATWFFKPGRVATALFFGLALFFWNVIGALALGLGLGDTWLDWRGRGREHSARS